VLNIKKNNQFRKCQHLSRHRIIVLAHLGAVHKRRPQKIDPLPPCSHNIRTGSNPPCPCGNTINSKNPDIFAPKSADARIWRTLLPCPHWTNPPDCGRRLWTASYKFEYPKTLDYIKTASNQLELSKLLR